MTHLEEAQANLKAYFDGLEPEVRVRALEFQASLEKEAEKTPGGMTQVIVSRMRHNAALLTEALDDVRRISAGLQADTLIAKHRR